MIGFGATLMALEVVQLSSLTVRNEARTVIPSKMGQKARRAGFYFLAA